MLRARIDAPIHGLRALLSRLLCFDVYVGADLEDRALQVRLILFGFGFRLWIRQIQIGLRLFWPAGFIDLAATEWKTVL
jgi:hypothetical protein